MKFTLLSLAVFLIFILFLVANVSAVDDRIVRANLDEEHFRVDMWWRGFIPGCKEGDNPFSVGGNSLDDVKLDLEFNFDTGIVTGTLAGGQTVEYGTSYEDLTFDGEITGHVEKANNPPWWFWEYNGTIDLNLKFTARKRCTDVEKKETYWKERTETVPIKAEFSGSSWAGRDGIGSFNLAWEDEGGAGSYPKRSFRLSCDKRLPSGGCDTPVRIPVALDLNAKIKGPIEIDPDFFHAEFGLESSGADTGMIHNATWHFYYFDQDFGDYRWFQTIKRSDAEKLVLGLEEMAEWPELAGKFGRTTGDVSSLDMKVQAQLYDQQGRELTLNQSFNIIVDHTFVFRAKAESTTGRFRLTGVDGLPLRNLKVFYQESGTKGVAESYRTVTDENGFFDIPNIKSDTDYSLEIPLEYCDIQYSQLGPGTLRECKTFFTIHTGSDEKPVKIIIAAKNDEMFYLGVRNNHKELVTVIIGEGAKNQVSIRDGEIRLGDFLTKENEFISYLATYQHFSEAVWFYRKGLQENIDFGEGVRRVPLSIYLFQKRPDTRFYTVGKYREGRGTGYDDNRILINEPDSAFESINRPRVAYHEFNHFVMYNLYNRKWPRPSKDLPVNIGELNHGGFTNPSTSDSYVEGFAEFMAAGIQYTMEEASIATIPTTEPKINARGLAGGLMAAQFLSTIYSKRLELNRKPWEANGISEEYALAGVLWDLVDGPGEYRISEWDPDKAYENYLKSWSEFEKEYGEPLSKKKHSLEFFKNYNWDDDNVEFDFEELWKILRVYHPDFTSIYKALIEKFPEKKKDIDEVFKAHGFFADKNPGDGKYDEGDVYRDENGNNRYDSGEYYLDLPKKEVIEFVKRLEIDINYDEGEEIGPAADFNRPWRSSIPELPGHYIKVDNEIPYYIIQFFFPEGPHLSYITRSRNNEGLVYVEVPPSDYDAVITIYPEGAESEPLSFDSRKFHIEYADSLEKGYYKEHHFEISGEIPSTESSLKEDQISGILAEGSGRTVIIVLIVLIVAVAFFILLKKQLIPMNKKIALLLVLILLIAVGIMFFPRGENAQTAPQPATKISPIVTIPLTSNPTLPPATLPTTAPPSILPQTTQPPETTPPTTIIPTTTITLPPTIIPTTTTPTTITTTSTTTSSTTTTEPKPTLVVLDETIVDNVEDKFWLGGKLRNNGETETFSVKVRLTLYNEMGSIMQTINSVPIDRIGPGETIEFNTIKSDKVKTAVASYEVSIHSGE
jgi:hypothetical protein